MTHITRILTIALIAAAALAAPGSPITPEPSTAEATASYCYVNYGYNFAQVTCTRGNYGDPYYGQIRCERDAWWSNHRVWASGNLGRVGYGSPNAYSHVQCPSGYKRVSGVTIYK